MLRNIQADCEIIIVDDGSSDNTGRIADDLAADDARIRVIHHEHNLGYGQALQSGFRAATKELVFYAFKLYKRSVFDSIKMESTGVLTDSEVLTRATRRGFRIVRES